MNLEFQNYNIISNIHKKKTFEKNNYRLIVYVLSRYNNIN